MLREELCLAIVLRGDLRLSAGKAVAQAAHAAVEAITTLPDEAMISEWRATGQLIVVLSAPNEDGLATLIAECQRRDLGVSVVRDSGRTEVPSGTLTSIAIGPHERAAINQVTSGLDLY